MNSTYVSILVCFMKSAYVQLRTEGLRFVMQDYKRIIIDQTYLKRAVSRCWSASLVFTAIDITRKLRNNVQRYVEYEFDINLI